jgi:hypothetical protein
MRFARPPDGFRLLIDEGIEAYIGAWAAGSVERRRAWRDIKDRLRIVAAREGSDRGKNRFVMTFRDQPRDGDLIRVAYVIHADSVHVLSVFCKP